MGSNRFDIREDLSCGGYVLKFILATINIIFFVAGLAIAAFAGYAAFAKNSKIHQLMDSYNIPLLYHGLYVLLAVGIFLALVSFIGMWGTIAQNACMLKTYFFIIFLLLVVQIAGTILSFVEFKKIEKKVIAELGKPPSRDKTARIVSSVVAAGIEILEKEFHCCGINGPKDYKDNQPPSSCYAPVSNNIAHHGIGFHQSGRYPYETEETRNPSSFHEQGKLYTRGCIHAVKPYLYAAGGIAIGVMFLQVLVLIFACCLIADINKYESLA